MLFFYCCPTLYLHVSEAREGLSVLMFLLVTKNRKKCFFIDKKLKNLTLFPNVQSPTLYLHASDAKEGLCLARVLYRDRSDSEDAMAEGRGRWFWGAGGRGAIVNKFYCH